LVQVAQVAHLVAAEERQVITLCFQQLLAQVAVAEVGQADLKQAVMAALVAVALILEAVELERLIKAEMVALVIMQEELHQAVAVAVLIMLA
jgi:hypothetical protein